MSQPVAVPTLAIIGRPNVGKSTLFNLLSHTDKALVHASAGTTRDVRRVPANLFGRPFTMLDTAGIEEGRQMTELQGSLNVLARNAASAADVLLFVLDGGTGLLPADRALAGSLHKLGKPVVVVVNKADLKTAESVLPEVENLGLGQPVLLSAAHGQGLSDLEDALAPYLPVAPEAEEPEDDIGELLLFPDDEQPENDLSGIFSEADDDGAPLPKADEPAAKAPVFTPPEVLRIAILGRPNVGKSTLVNKLLNEDKMLTGPVAGLTREAIGHDFTRGNQKYRLVDTPGLRKKANIVEDLEQLAVGQSLTAANKADMAILVVDVSGYDLDSGTWQVFEQQDARIAGAILNAGKPLVVALNKWDAVREKEDCLKDTTFQLSRRLHQLAAPLALPISAQRGKGLDAMLDSCMEAYAAYHARWGTAKLNRELQKILARRSPPLAANRQVVNLKYVSQTASRPPTLSIWGNRVADLPDSYKLFLRNQFAERLGLQHVPLRFTFRRNRNPFAKTPAAGKAPAGKSAGQKRRTGSKR